MKKSSKIQSLLLFLSILLPTYAFADDNYTSKLNNQSKKSGTDGFYLVRDEVWSEYDCVADKGKDRINPGESNDLTIKKGCKWGGIRYKIFSVTNNKDMGYLGHSFRDGNFSMDITSPCKGSECNFSDLNPQQNRE